MKIFAPVAIISVLSVLPVPAQTPAVTAVVNVASFKNSLSPGVLASVFGTNLSGNSLQVTLSGDICPVLFSSAGQLNIQLPWEAPAGVGSIVVTHDGLGSAPFAVTLATFSPALFSSNGSGSGPGVFTSGSHVISAQNPANGGDILSTVGVGLGPTSPQIATGETTPLPPPTYATVTKPAITVGGTPALVSASVLEPLAIGIDQINFVMPASSANPNPNVALKIGGLTGNPVTIPVACKQVNSLVTVAKGKPVYKPGPNVFLQTVQIQDTSTTTLPASGSLVLTNLSSRLQLGNGGGATCPSSDGSPYKSFSFTGTPQTATLTLVFSDPGMVAIAYTARVLVP